MESQSSHFEEILLPPVILADLFPNSLVLIDTIHSPLQKEEFRNIDVVAEEKEFFGDIIVPASIEEQSLINPAETQLVTGPIWLGNFNKHILVLVHDEESMHLGDSELELLSKMLQALKLSIADIAIINCGKNTIRWSSLIKDFAARQVIFFGVDPSSIEVPIRLPHFRVHRWNDTGFLYSPSLITINKVSPDQTALKKELWKALQELFAG